MDRRDTRVASQDNPLDRGFTLVLVSHGAQTRFIVGEIASDIHGDADSIVPHEKSERFAARLKEHKVPHQLITCKNAGHR